MSRSLQFDLDRIRRQTFVRHVESHDVLASTNDRGIELAGEPNIPTPLLILAGEQTAGRGRGANRWWWGPGALTFSLVFDPRQDLAARGWRPLDAEHWP